MERQMVMPKNFPEEIRFLNAMCLRRGTCADCYEKSWLVIHDEMIYLPYCPAK